MSILWISTLIAGRSGSIAWILPGRRSLEALEMDISEFLSFNLYTFHFYFHLIIDL
ncbi:hypothetical protein KSP40_PGU000988 [Platanthera guangdongensis]|uniref:Uncharacterized protein n=1 Tax=Platanthera guangdongensis TaxID=2320717 RepID=A0ABR2MQR9_9ASPA